MFKVAAVLCFVVLVSCARDVSFEELANRAVTHSQELELYRYDFEIEKAKAQNVRSALWPTLSLSFNTEYAKTFDENRSSLDSIGDTVISSGTGYKSSISLNMNYSLFDFGVLNKKIAMADKSSKIKRLEWCSKEKNLVQKVLDYYIETLKTQVELDIVKRIII